MNVAIPGDVCGALAPCPQVPGAITTSAFGSFYQNVVKHTYNDVLPSANLKFDLDKNLVLRFAVAETMARPDYSALGGSITADDTTHTGNGGNPNLKPIRSTNFDAALEWYFAPRSLLSAGLFYMDLTNYVALRHLPDAAAQHPHQQRSRPTRSRRRSTAAARSKGVELAWQQPLRRRLRRASANYTYADAEGAARHGATTDLVGASKNTVQRQRATTRTTGSARASRTPTARRSSSASTAARRSTRTTPARSPPR